MNMTWFTEYVVLAEDMLTWLFAAAPMDRLRGPNETNDLRTLRS